MSRIGKLSIKLPENVQFSIKKNNFEIIGPYGNLNQMIPNEIQIKVNNNIVQISKTEETRSARQKYGLIRSLVNNMIIGTTIQFEKKLQMIGVGYRAQIKEQELILNVGYSHPIIFLIPKDIQIKIENNIYLRITGSDKEKIGIFASKIRDTRPPEPYKGKGIRYLDEFVLRKAGKSGKK